MYAFDRFHAIGLLMLAATCIPARGLAQTAAPHVHVNNVHLSDVEIAALAVLNCNTAVPDGDYWIDFETGAWGYAGGPQQGVMGCHDAALQTPTGSGSRQTAPSTYAEDRTFDSMTSAFPGRSLPSVANNPVYP